MCQIETLPLLMPSIIFFIDNYFAINTFFIDVSKYLLIIVASFER